MKPGNGLLVLCLLAIPFHDISSISGLTARLNQAATPERHLIETMAGGIGFFDYDRDGKPDLYMTNGAPQPSLSKSGPEFWNRLYRNKGNGQFEDVTERAGVKGAGFDIGVAAGDYDNDGWPDLFVAGVARNVLYRNRGDGTFADVTDKAGLAKPASKPWAVAAGWFDMDNDGDLDLFVVNYVIWDPAQEPYCGDRARGLRTYCHPKEYDPLPNALYRNNGDGTFTDVSAESGIASHAGKGMGLAFGDMDGDGRLDVFVTNDTAPNFLFHNEGGGRFQEVAGPSGVAFNDDGRALSSMGADFRDWDNDGQDDLFITALTNETFPLFRNQAKGVFADRTYVSQVGKATLAMGGWGGGVFDLDNDGWKDLFAACSDVQDNLEKYSGRASKQPNLFLRNRGAGTFEPQTVGRPALHRGAAFADFDTDGRVDIAVSRLMEPPLLLRNEMGAGRHWIAVRLKGTRSNRQGLGAMVKIVSASGRMQWNRVTTSVGYASSSEPVAHFGLGAEPALREVEILWPSGVVQKLERPAADRYLDVTEP